MWPWIKRWRDWAMHDFWFMHRIGPQPQALHYSYEKAGLTLHDQPIPWNAEVVLVEAILRLPPAVARRKADFQLLLPGQLPIPAENLHRQESEDHYHLFFRFPPPASTTTAELRWRHHQLGQLTLPVLSRDEFLQHLRLQLRTLFVRLGDQTVACQTFVSTQCRGLMATALITSPTSLVPLLDVGLQVEFRSERGGPGHVVPVRLCSSQLAEREALVAVVPRGFPRRIGTWTATWMLGDRSLGSQRVRAISQRHFHRSLRVSDTRFVVQTKEGVHLSRQVPALEKVARVGPCFLVCSREPGMAGLCPLQVRVQVPGAVQPPALEEQDILITDGPTVVAPGTLDVADLAQVSAFELRRKNELLGLLSLSPIPVANFTAEGGFKPPSDFTWSGAAEEELTERLARLLEGRGNGEAR
ncbi:MAG: hypothetical protein JO112_14480 [Planctomycetes bacterium]|nr:hypothetical protein [Planctomycetota bacterium]